MGEYHDEDTLFKVRNALLHVGLTEETATECINEMQNRNILFRELVIGGGNVFDKPTHEGETRQQSPILKYFNYNHLPEHLQKISQPFHDTAYWIEDTLPAGPEKSVALRKLLEAKDAAVRTLV